MYAETREGHESAWKVGAHEEQAEKRTKLIYGRIRRRADGGGGGNIKFRGEGGRGAGAQQPANWKRCGGAGSVWRGDGYPVPARQMIRGFLVMVAAVAMAAAVCLRLQQKSLIL